MLLLPKPNHTCKRRCPVSKSSILNAEHPPQPLPMRYKNIALHSLGKNVPPEYNAGRKFPSKHNWRIILLYLKVISSRQCQGKDIRLETPMAPAVILRYEATVQAKLCKELASLLCNQERFFKQKEAHPRKACPYAYTPIQTQKKWAFTHIKHRSTVSTKRTQGMYYTHEEQESW